jgi:hypothetical protein
LASTLQQAILKVSDPILSDTCYSSNTFDRSIVYCAFNSDGDHKSNACFGDSGGPLIYYKDNKWHIYGNECSKMYSFINKIYCNYLRYRKLYFDRYKCKIL